MDAIDDLRSFLDLLGRHGAIHDITAPVDRVHELGAILKACEQDGRATWFHDVARCGKPCSSTTGGPSSGPWSETSKTRPSCA